MKKIIYNSLTIFILISCIACDVDYEDNPNEPVIPPTDALFNDATKLLIDESRDEWFEGRFTLTTMQYWAQVNYTEEDRYQYRPTLPNTWRRLYRALENYRIIINLNTNEKTKDIVNVKYGPNEGQIATSRIMLSYAFNIMTDTFGDIPYYSYGNKNPNFQALNAQKDKDEILRPKYATQKEIYLDILNELKAASEQLKPITEQFIKGDPVYSGNLKKWQKFANSLRLRVAIKLLNTSEKATAQQHINEAKTLAFTSNDDNAVLKYETSDLNAAPFYKAYKVENRVDFAVAYPFVSLLKGIDLTTSTPKVNPFKGIEDPRLKIFADKNKLNMYVGMPYGISSDDTKSFKWESMPGEEIIKANFAVPLMDYAEVEFILSELENWDNEHYKKAIMASLLHWGIGEEDANEFLEKLPAATQENVLTQKYIALYMQSHSAWTEYRRTGFPKYLIMPGDKYKIEVQVDEEGKMQSFDYEFTPLAEIEDLPNRIKYPGEEANINGNNLKEAISRLQGGDKITSKLWWDVN